MANQINLGLMRSEIKISPIIIQVGKNPPKKWMGEKAVESGETISNERYKSGFGEKDFEEAFKVAKEIVNEKDDEITREKVDSDFASSSDNKIAVDIISQKRRVWISASYRMGLPGYHNFVQFDAGASEDLEDDETRRDKFMNMWEDVIDHLKVVREPAIKKFGFVRNDES